jgi:DNA-binding response OmpR family regulator
MDASKPHILIVDDEMGPRESLKMILNPYYNVHVAERGAQAVELLKQIPVDLVTLDLKMPGFSGINVLEKVKQIDPDIEAIIITGYGSLDTAIEGLRLGAFDYISKPFDVNHILSLVRRGLDRRNAKSRLRQVKSDFLSNVSHELRTPLSVVVGFVYLLLNQVIGKLSEEQQKVLETVYRNSEELLELIDNVLWMTSLNAGDSHASSVSSKTFSTTPLNLLLKAKLPSKRSRRRTEPAWSLKLSIRASVLKKVKSIQSSSPFIKLTTRRSGLIQASGLVLPSPAAWQN